MKGLPPLVFSSSHLFLAQHQHTQVARANDLIDGRDCDTPRGVSAKEEVMRIRRILRQIAEDEQLRQPGVNIAAGESTAAMAEQQAQEAAVGEG